MKIIFMGTPDFAVPGLTAINNSDHDIIAVVTQPDRPKGRGRALGSSAVKECALKYNLKLIQPESVTHNDFIEELKALKPDCIVVIAFIILPEEIIAIPTHGCFNVHASLLPKYRGAAPINWALINGETKTGLTTFFLNKKIDDGEIILQEEMEIVKDEDYGSLYDRMMSKSAGIVINTLTIIQNKSVTTQKQNSELKSYAPKMTKETGLINWTESAKTINNLIRGVTPQPGAYTHLDGRILKIFSSDTQNLNNIEYAPGEVVENSDKLVIACGTGSLIIYEIQIEGKKRMTVEEFMRGVPITKNEILGLNKLKKTV